MGNFLSDLSSFSREMKNGKNADVRIKSVEWRRAWMALVLVLVLVLSGALAVG